MRWFKHLTDTWSDEKIASLISENGLEIYGLWWRILEIIGKQMNGTDKAFCRYSAKSWAKFSGISPKKFWKFAEILAEKKLIIVNLNGDDIDINVPNLLKYRDEYSEKKNRDKDKKSG